MAMITVTADDLGLSLGVNAGIIEAHRWGPVANASLMVHGRAVDGIDEVMLACPGLAIGLHVDLGEWEYRDDGWVASYERVDTDDPDAVAREVADQLVRFERLVGGPPTHLDSHQHIHRDGAVSGIIAAMAAQLAVPLREVTHAYLGGFYGQDQKSRPVPESLTAAAWAALLSECIAPLTELSCHPSTMADTGSIYDAERIVELGVLTSPEVAEACVASGHQFVRLDGPPSRAGAAATKVRAIDPGSVWRGEPSPESWDGLSG